ncbi:hypothetical protein HK098_004819 [Nowakowskiella sp. JEL0407]|nr:hypothetical protein HK098_004819 [Nowakowskiella sp. JEL0407]
MPGSIAAGIVYYLTVSPPESSQYTFTHLRKVLLAFYVAVIISDFILTVQEIRIDILNTRVLFVAFQLWIAIILMYLELKVGDVNGEVHLGGGSSEYSGPLKPCEEEKAGFVKKAFFGWVNELIWIGNARVLENADVNDLPVREKAQTAYGKYQTVLTTSTTNSFFWNLAYAVLPTLTKQYVFGILAGLLSISSPYFLNRILVGIQSTDPEIHNGVWTNLFLMFIVAAIKAMCEGQAYFNGRRVSTQLRGIICTELYNKVLKRPITYGGKNIEAKSPETSTFTDEESGTASNAEEVIPEDSASPTTPKASNSDASLGQIINLQSADTEMIVTYVSYSHEVLFKIPLALILTVSGLFLVVGWSALVGLSIIILSGPATMFIMGLARKIQEASQAASDKRVNLINEVLQGIRVVKYLAWEPEFIRRINIAREGQIAQFFKMFWVNIAVSNVNFSSSIFVMVATFACFTTIQRGQLNPAVAFTAMALLRQTADILQRFPQYLTGVIQSMVALKRIEKFLSQEELETVKSEESAMIGFRNATLTYHGSDESGESGKAEGMTKSRRKRGFMLKDLTVGFPEGKLSCLIGSTGSGKTSLILGLLGELKVLQGSVCFPSKRSSLNTSFSDPNGVAYVGQTSWLINATIRDNILFGTEYDEARYRQVINVCALTKDFEILEGGDMTEVGEKGINLSGGQKQRISLARAAYSNASIILLDDPLSAVDAPTAKHLFRKCILGFMKNKTRLLVTHATSLVLPSSDYIVLLKNGKIVSHGTPGSIVAHQAETGLPKTVLGEAMDVLESSGFASSDVEDVESIPSAPEIDDKPKKEAKKLVQDEERANGSVSWEVYLRYFRSAGGVSMFLIVCLALVLSQFAVLASDWWLKRWSEASAEGEVGANLTLTSLPPTQSDSVTSSQNYCLGFSCFQPPLFSLIETLSEPSSISLLSVKNISTSTGMYIGVYVLLGLLIILIENLNFGVMFLASVRAARNIHLILLKSVLGSPLSFFEQTPIGRILNRFSKDMTIVDGRVFSILQLFLQQIIKAVFVMFVVMAVVPPFFLLLPIIGYLYVLIAQAYLNASRELQRLESVSSSPIYALFSETLSGVTTIRAYGHQQRFIGDNTKKVNTNHRFYFYLWAANRWLCLRTDLISALTTLVAGLLIMAGNIPTGWAGLCLTYSSMLSDVFLWIIRIHAMMEISMNSVERVFEYTDLPQEPAAIIENSRPPLDWPNAGQISVDKLAIKYAPDLPYVIKEISFDITPGEKIGIVGRTGAGKSTLSLAFFRIVNIEGTIKIDGVDISKIGLYDLRSRLNIIPQDPVLFSGSLRQSLDPMAIYSDEVIYEALTRVHFIETIQQQTENQSSENLLNPDPTNPLQILDMNVAENGTNLSLGQRQLLCLARALLSRSKVVILDEATASVDHFTDMQIQSTIRNELKGTILTIAHRLRTIIDYDRIMVLEQGSIREFGTALELLNYEGGLFRKMAEESGEFTELYAMARGN